MFAIVIGADRPAGAALKRRLEAVGYDTDLFSDPDEFLEYLDDPETPPDAVALAVDFIPDAAFLDEVGGRIGEVPLILLADEAVPEEFRSPEVVTDIARRNGEDRELMAVLALYRDEKYPEAAPPARFPDDEDLDDAGPGGDSDLEAGAQ